jgi:hypothetical protein
MSTDDSKHEVHLDMKPSRYPKHPLSLIEAKASVSLLSLNSSNVLGSELITVDEEIPAREVVVLPGSSVGVQAKLLLVYVLMYSISTLNSAFICSNTSKLPVLCLPRR